MVYGALFHSTNTKQLLLTGHCYREYIMSNADKMPILRFFIIFITITKEGKMTTFVLFVVFHTIGCL